MKNGFPKKEVKMNIKQTYAKKEMEIRTNDIDIKKIFLLKEYA